MNYFELNQHQFWKTIKIPSEYCFFKQKILNIIKIRKKMFHSFHLEHIWKPNPEYSSAADIIMLYGCLQVSQNCNLTVNSTENGIGKQSSNSSQLCAHVTLIILGKAAMG